MFSRLSITPKIRTRNIDNGNHKCYRSCLMNHNTFPLISSTPEVNQSLPENNYEQVVHKVVGEFTWQELDAGSGIFQENGGELSNLQAIELINNAHGAQGVFLSANGYLSPEGHQYNREVTREIEFARRPRDPSLYKVAVVARYPGNVS